MVLRWAAGALTALGLVTALGGGAAAAPVYDVIESGGTAFGILTLPAPTGACAFDGTSAWDCVTGANPLNLGPPTQTMNPNDIPSLGDPAGGINVPSLFGIWEVDPIGRLSGNFLFTFDPALDDFTGFLRIQLGVGTLGIFDLATDLQNELLDIQDLISSASQLLASGSLSPTDFSDFFDAADNLFVNVLTSANCGTDNCMDVTTPLRQEEMPEPAALAVFGLGLMLMAMIVRRRRVATRA
jgi:hypothetical protein